MNLDKCPRCYISWGKVSSVSHTIRMCTCGLEFRGWINEYQEFSVELGKFKLNWWPDKNMCQVMQAIESRPGKQQITQLPLLPFDATLDDVEKYMVLV